MNKIGYTINTRDILNIPYGKQGGIIVEYSRH